MSMDEGSAEQMGRRKWLETVVGGAALAGLAGCIGDDSDDSDGGTPGTETEAPGTDAETDTETPTETPEPEELGGDGDLPGYASTLTVPEIAPADDPYSFFVLDVEVFDWGDDEEPETATPTPTPEEDEAVDPLINNPLGAIVGVGTIAALGTIATGLSDLVNTDEETTAQDVPTESIALTEGGLVFMGEFDTDRVASNVRGAGLSEEETVGEFTLFYDGDGTAVAVGSEYVLSASNGDDDDVRERLRGVAETIAGSRERYYEAREDVEWLLRTAGEGDIVVGRITEADGMVPSETDEEDDQDDDGIEIDNTIYEDARGVVHFLDTGPDAAETRAEAGFVYDDAGLVDTGWLESRAGFTADEQMVDSRDEKAVVEASWYDD